MTTTIPPASTSGTPPGIPTSLGGGLDVNIGDAISAATNGGASTSSDSSSTSGASSSTNDSSSSGASSESQPKTPATYDPTASVTSASGETGEETPSPPPASDPSKRVVDLNDAGLVFSVLREGVDAWRASLGVPTDSWGNEMSEGYMEARRPDYVCEGLRAFLKDYYKDKPGIYASLGPGDLPPPPPAAPADPTPTTSSDATSPTTGPTADTQEKDAVVATADPSASTDSSKSPEDVPDISSGTDSKSDDGTPSTPMAPSTDAPTTASASSGGETGNDS